MEQREWSEQEQAECLRLIRKGHVNSTIARKLNRTESAVRRWRSRNNKPTVGAVYGSKRDPVPRRFDPPQYVWDERERYAAEPDSLATLILGDPKPSRSALNHR